MFLHQFLTNLARQIELDTILPCSCEFIKILETEKFFNVLFSQDVHLVDRFILDKSKHILRTAFRKNVKHILRKLEAS